MVMHANGERFGVNYSMFNLMINGHDQELSRADPLFNNQTSYAEFIQTKLKTK